MRECDAQRAAAVLVALRFSTNHGYVCVADSYSLHVRIAGWNHDPVLHRVNDPQRATIASLHDAC